VKFVSRTLQRWFFDETKQQFENWSNFYDELSKNGHAKVSFRQLRRWRLGQALPTLTVVELICHLTGQDPKKLALTLRSPNWGQRQGGLIKAAKYGCNLTLSDRVRGGRITGKSQSISHLRTIGSIGGSNSAKSHGNPHRQVLGPDGVRMFNDMEREVMMRIIREGLEVIYEPVIKVGLRRLIPDFQVGSTYIECTCDTQVRVKARRLGEKFRLLRGFFGSVKCLLVTLPKLVPRYMSYLEPHVEVATVQDFIERIPEFWCGPGRI
jgi:hypothetical protein